MLESSSEIFKVSLEDVVLFSLCFSGIFLWPLLWVLTLVEKLKVSAALAQANKYSGAGSESAKNVLEATKDSVKNKSFLENAKLEMNSLSGKTTRKVNELGAAEKLAALKASMNLPQIEGQEND
jgi:hypothetical protein